MLDAVLGMLAPAGRLCTLVKPQFEAARQDVGAGGVVRDPQVHREVLRRVADVVDQAGLGVCGLCPSPIHGAKGNIEYLLYLNRNEDASYDIDKTVEEAHAELLKKNV